MATITLGERLSAPAGADLTGKRYHIVKEDANNNIVLATAATDNIVGVLDSEGKLGDTVDVVLLNGHGTFKVKTSGAIAKDAFLTANASGQAISTTTTGNRVIGRARRASVTGEVAEYIKTNEKY